MQCTCAAACSKGNTLLHHFILFHFRVLENARECGITFFVFYSYHYDYVNMLDRVMFMVLIMARPGEKGKGRGKALRSFSFGWNLDRWRRTSRTGTLVSVPVSSRIALARACPCAHGVQRGGLGRWLARVGACNSPTEREANETGAMPHLHRAARCGRGASPSRTSCAMISTATTEPACVSLSATAAFSPAVPVAPPPRRALAPGTAKACTVPSTGPARGSPLSHGRAGHASIAKLQITSLGQSTSLYHCAHVMTTVHMPIYCAGSATIYHALEKDEELLLACFCRLNPGASYRIGIASPAALHAELDAPGRRNDARTPNADRVRVRMP